MVRDATTAVTNKVIKNKSTSNLEDKDPAIITEVDPEITPQISPTTSQQKLDTF